MKINYRPEIDGLRAISVCAVILYHCNLNFFYGGFIGVDIFFVISGYLITSIILKELIKTNSFSFTHFYIKRIRRILPVLLVVIITSLPFAWIILLPNNFVEFSNSIIYSIGFSSNFYFWGIDQQYGSESSLLKPFLHTWSLAVEEQFYILYPIFLFLTFKFLRKYLIHIFLLGFIFSISIAHWGSQNYPSANFYFLVTRIWELMAGSILAYFETCLGYRSKKKFINFTMSIFGLLLIVYSIIFFDHSVSHPSFYTLIPITGVCLIIFYSSKENFITRILSNKLLVGIGLISYSLYLWHYPIFAFARIIGLFEKSIFSIIYLILFTILISIFSYFFIEKKFREEKFKFNKILKIIILAYLIILIYSFTVILNNGFKKRFPDFFEKFDSNIFNLLKTNNNESCMSYFYCSSNEESEKKVFLLGDSIMASISYDLQKKLTKKNYQFIPLTISNCLFFENFDQINLKTNKISNTCNASEINKRVDLIKQNPNSIIIIGGMFGYHLSGIRYDDFHKKKYDKLIEYKSLNSSNIKRSFKGSVLELSKKNNIILIYPYPELSFDLKEKVQKKYFLQKKNFIEILNEKYYSEPYKNYLSRSKETFHLFDSINNNNIHRVYPHLLVCNNFVNKACVAHDKKNIFYVDSLHPSLIAIEKINKLILKEIETIELK